jgi:cytidylate kinase
VLYGIDNTDFSHADLVVDTGEPFCPTPSWNLYLAG